MSENSMPVQDNAPLNERILKILDGDMHEKKAKFRQFLSSPEMRLPPAGTSTPERRNIAYQQLLHFINSEIPNALFPEEYGGTDNLVEYLNFVDSTGHHDASFGVKQGVNFALCVGALSKLGTEKHYKEFFQKFRTGEITGGLALTEVGGGSTVQNLKTTATYDASNEEFIIHTPNDDARKSYIGNAAQHGDYVVVYAQLIADGKSEGAHGFMVPIRDEHGNLLPGIEVEDCGEKTGLPGVDNGYIKFTQLRVKKDALLDRLGWIDENNKYQTNIENPGVRFIKTIGALVTGRVLVASTSITAAQNAIANAIDFSLTREVAGGNLMDKKAQQEDVFGDLAKIYAGSFAKRHLIANAGTETRDFDDYATAMKILLSEYGYDAIDNASTAMGGKGFMAESKIGRMRADLDVFQTFEGANTALRLFSARNQLKGFAKTFAKASGLHKVGLLTKSLRHRFNLRARPKDLLDPRFQMEALEARENAMRVSLAMKAQKITGQALARAKAQSEKPLSKEEIKQVRNDALMEFGDLHQIELRQYSDAFGEKLILEQFIKGIESIDNDPEAKAALKDLCDLYAISIIDKNSKWFLENGYMTTRTTKKFLETRKELYDRIRDNAEELINGFGIPESLRTLENPLKKIVTPQNSIPTLSFA